MTQYGLSEEDCNKVISDIHMDKISRLYCKHCWRSIPPYLELHEIIVYDIQHSYKTEEEQRKQFFTKWKEIKGNKATYKTLLHALLQIRKTPDAENICRLLAKAEYSVQNNAGRYPVQLHLLYVVTSTIFSRLGFSNDAIWSFRERLGQDSQ